MLLADQLTWFKLVLRLQVWTEGAGLMTPALPEATAVGGSGGQWQHGLWDGAAAFNN